MSTFGEKRASFFHLQDQRIQRERILERSCACRTTVNVLPRTLHYPFLFLVVWPGAPKSFLFLVAMPGAPGSVLAPSSDALCS